MRVTILITSMIIFFSIIVFPSTAKVWQAGNDSTLSEALSEAQPNDVIYLNPGTYTNAISLNKKGLSIIGKNAYEVIFDIPGSNLELNAERCSLQGVTIVNSSKGVSVKSSGCEISECVFEGLTYKYGVYITVDDTIFKDNVVSNCTGTNYAVCGKSDDCIYTGNTFINNNCAGLCLGVYSANNVVWNNIFRQNDYGINIWNAGANNQIYLNYFIENNEAIIATNPPSIRWASPDPIIYTYKNSSFSNCLGNYWDGYYGTDEDENGVLDTSYIIPYEAGADQYPLAHDFQTYAVTATDPADLVIDSFSPETLVAQQPNRIRVNVSNKEEGDAGAFKLRLYYGEKLVGEEVVPSLAAGNSTQVSFTLMPPEGTINLRAVVDVEDNVEESLESNNEFSGNVVSQSVDTDENWFQFHKDVEHTGYYPGEGPDDETLLWVSDYINAVGSSSPVIADGKVFVNCGDSDMSSAGDEDSLVIGLNMYTGEISGSFGPGSTAWNSWASPCYYNGNISCGRPDSVNGGDMIVNGKRYVGDYMGSRYHCTYESNGTEIWTKSVKGVAQGTPAYSDGMVYLTSCIHEETGDVYCVDAETGEEIWHLSTPPRQTASGTASIYNDILYFTTYNWFDKGRIYALDKYDGTILWWSTIHRTDSCPALAYGKIYVCGGCPRYSDLQTYCFDAITGETIWKTTESRSGIGGWTCSPVVADGKCYVGKCDSGMFSYSDIYAFDAYDGEQLWSSPGGGSTPAISEGILYTVGNDGRVYAYGSFSDPHAEFTASVSSGGAPLTVSFTDMSEPDITGWQWDFDNDGAVDSTEQNPVYIFESAGDYTVSLEVTNSEGTDTEIKEAYITVTGEGILDDWNPWNDPSSVDGSNVTTPELQKGIKCWLYDLPAPNTGELVNTSRLQHLIAEWLES